MLGQTKKDLKGAEEYYSRAILADPSDGEILSQYAKLIWELHRDEDRATSYFERAVQAASSDRFASHTLLRISFIIEIQFKNKLLFISRTDLFIFDVLTATYMQLMLISSGR